MTEPQLGGTFDQQLAAAKWAESEGLVSYARSDHLLWEGDSPPDATDAFAVLAGLARETSRIRLCVLVTPVTFRHPAIIAKNAATIDQMSAGRLDLGVGTGWMELEHEALGIPFPDWGERWQRLNEAIDYLDAAFGPDRGSFAGDYYSLDADVRPKPTGIRLVIGGGGRKRTPTLAGQRADEYNTYLRPAADAKERIDVMRRAAGDREVEATVMGPALVGRTDAEYRDRLGRAAAARGHEPDDLEGRFAEAGIPMGTPNRATEAVSALEEAGVQRWYVQWLDLDDLDGMKETVSVVRGG